MAHQKSVDLHSAYAELNKACSNQNYDRVVNLANKILTKQPKELKAFQCKVVAYIRMEKYEECLSLIKKQPAFLDHVLYEKAYIEYRLNRMNDVCKTLESIDTDDLRVDELKAQVLYRREQFSEAYTCLRNVIKNSQDEYGEERLTNLAAVAAAAACFQNMNLDININPEMYEGKFNIGCYHLGCGNLKLAMDYIDSAEAQCNDCLSDDPEITEEEKNEELAPIRVQRAYLMQLEKNEEQANQIYQSVTRQRLSDLALVAVAANNIVCINREQNIFDSRKRIKMTSLDGLEYKLFAHQRTNMLINQSLFYWHTNQMDACNVRLLTIMQERMHSRALLLSVTQLLKEKQAQKAFKLLQDFCANLAQTSGLFEDHTNLAVLLALAQLNLRYNSNYQLTTGTPSAQNALNVANLFKNYLPDSLLHLPGIVSTRIALYIMASNGENSVCSRAESLKFIVDCIKSSLNWYESTGNIDKVYLHLLDRCSTFLLQHGEAEFAANLYEKQIAHLDSTFSSAKESTSDKHRQLLVARLVRAYAQFDRSRAEQVCKTLQFNVNLSDADVDTLETSFLYGAKSVRRLGRTTTTTTSEQNDNKAKAKHIPGQQMTPNTPITLSDNVQVGRRPKHKKKKIRLPKNYQPGTVPDPDRWLPRHERAHYRGKRRDKRHIQTRGPQGQVAGGHEWDASTRSPNTNQNMSPRMEPHDANVSSPRQTSGAAKQQQRKGRRKGR